MFGDQSIRYLAALRSARNVAMAVSFASCSLMAVVSMSLSCSMMSRGRTPSFAARGFVEEVAVRVAVEFDGSFGFEGCVFFG